MKMVDGDLLVQHKYNTLHKDLIFLVNDLSGSEKKRKKDNLSGWVFPPSDLSSRVPTLLRIIIRPSPFQPSLPTTHTISSSSVGCTNDDEVVIIIIIITELHSYFSHQSLLVCVCDSNHKSSISPTHTADCSPPFLLVAIKKKTGDDVIRTGIDPHTPSKWKNSNVKWSEMGDAFVHAGAKWNWPELCYFLLYPPECTHI